MNHIQRPCGFSHQTGLNKILFLIIPIQLQEVKVVMPCALASV